MNQVVISLAREIRCNGTFRPLVLICDWNSPDPVFHEIDCITVVHWRIRPCLPRMGLKEAVGFWLWEHSFRQKFKDFCIAHGVEVINFHYPGLSALSIQRLISDLPSPPRLIFSFHGTDIQCLKGGTNSSILAWADMLDEPNFVVACSEDLRERIREVFRGRVEARVVHNGVDFETFAIQPDIRKPKNRRSILNVGRFDGVKAQDVLISAFALISDDYPDIDLVMVGSSGEALPRLKSMCVREGLSNRVRFHEAVPHQKVPDFYRSATVFAFPSRSEGCPLAILEAGASGLPVVASRVGGIPEILAEHDTGLLIAPDQPAELARSLCWMLDNPEEAKKMGERLRCRVQTHFTWTIACAKYLYIAGGAREMVRPEGSPD